MSRKAVKLEDLPRVPAKEGLARLTEFTRRIFAVPKPKPEDATPQPRAPTKRSRTA
jgi:hypothetical protein